MKPKRARRMNLMWVLLVFSAAVVAMGCGIPDSDAAEPETGSEYVCPPCGDKHDEQVFDKPGTCPICGMKLMKKEEVKKLDRPNVAILIFDGVQIIDYTGPYEVFGQGPFNVYTVLETGETITTAMGMSVNPSYSFATAPKPDILIVPGGHVSDMYESAKVMRWVRERASEAKHVMSVCNGAFILAKSGVLDGLTATTFYGLLDDFREFAPEVKVVSDQRFVDNGKIITTAGLSSGIDGSLYLISKLRGMGEAQALALHLEYDWHPDAGFARAALADMRLPKFNEPAGCKVTVVRTQGDRNHWEKQYRVSGEVTGEGLLSFLESEISKQEGWKRTSGGKSELNKKTRWDHSDHEGVHWDVATQVEPVSGSASEFLVSLQLKKAGRDKIARD